MSHDLLVVEQGNSDEILDMQKAAEVGDTLFHHYPDHMWVVYVQGGALVVKNLAISGNYGFILPKCHTAKELAAVSILAGGELLERAGMKRGRWSGEMAEKLEGSSPEFFKPFSQLEH